ncbi:hypothetical protein [Pseudotamlana carrageenivorans]|uniref:Secretion system C-terminal sorting domain-containing protein n=1 Tax=Pseudotamlana carrageenivorans TaxID=2069432 RepID=A0A2I7SJS2_9FLAO|nr:hypothetical protein [Tamlana carrageenivorans]AUS06142.1 hypothetical protein C1A40_12080 [Tamlana carrageenivorans]
MNNTFKNMKKGFLMLALFGTMLSFAEGPVGGINVEGTNTTLTLDYAKKGSAVSIKDSYGAVLYSETISTTGKYNKNFDLSFLPDGNYLFEVDKDLEFEEIPFTLNNGVAHFNKSQEKLFYKPYLRVSDDLVYINKLNLDNKNLTVNIYYTKGNSMNQELLVSEILTGDSKIEKVYKLAENGHGTYKIVLGSGGRFTETKIKI